MPFYKHFALPLMLSTSLFTGSNMFGQVSTINYSSSGLPTSLCNVFNVASPYSVSGFVHLPVSGGVTFTGSAIDLQTQAGTTLSTNLGTAYAIKYPFKNGKYYSIKIRASANNSNAYLEPCFFQSLPDPNTTNPTACGPVDQNSWGGFETNRYAGATYVSSSSYTDYTLSTFQAGNNFDYMIILASKGSQTSPTDVLIQTITITQSDAVAPTFSLSPSSIAKTCGTGINQTFTVDGTNIPGGASVTYTWDFGSSSNRWFLSGSPVGSTLTTSTNSITLTDASCDLAPSDITVTANVNGTNYPAGKVTVTMSPFMITGPSYVCTNSTSSNFSITNLGCSPSVTWTASPSGLVTINSPSSSLTTITYVSSGSLTLTATYSSACGSGTLSIPVTSGSPVPNGTSNYLSNYGSSFSNSISSQYVILGANHGQPGDNDVSYNYNIYDGLFSNYSWSVVSQPSGTSYQIVNDGARAWMYVTYSGTNGANAITLNLQATGPCGTYSQNITSTAARISGWGGYNMRVAPNPATSSTTVSLVSDGGPERSTNAIGFTGTNAKISPLIRTITLIDVSGKVVKTFSCRPGVSSVEISLNGVPHGLYNLLISNGIDKQSRQLLVQ